MFHFTNASWHCVFFSRKKASEMQTPLQPSQYSPDLSFTYKQIDFIRATLRIQIPQAGGSKINIDQDSQITISIKQSMIGEEGDNLLQKNPQYT